MKIIIIITKHEWVPGPYNAAHDTLESKGIFCFDKLAIVVDIEQLNDNPHSL